jgi:hypothetical protein
MYGANTTKRYSSNFLNERENYFHKPLVNINHFLELNDKMRMSSVLYWSGGSGGGTGTYGSVSRMPAVEGQNGIEVHLGLGIGMQKLHKILTTLMKTSHQLKIVQQEFLGILSTDKTHMV